MMLDGNTADWRSPDWVAENAATAQLWGRGVKELAENATTVAQMARNTAEKVAAADAAGEAAKKYTATAAAWQEAAKALAEAAAGGFTSKRARIVEQAVSATAVVAALEEQKTMMRMTQSLAGHWKLARERLLEIEMKKETKDREENQKKKKRRKGATKNRRTRKRKRRRHRRRRRHHQRFAKVESKSSARIAKWKTRRRRKAAQCCKPSR